MVRSEGVNAGFLVTRPEDVMVGFWCTDSAAVEFILVGWVLLVDPEGVFSEGCAAVSAY